MPRSGGSQVATYAGNDALARHMGFPDAQTMLAWKQRQLENQGPAQVANTINQPFSADTVKQALAIHPAVLFQNILDRLNQVM